MELNSENKVRKTRYHKLSDYCINSSDIERTLIGIIIIATLCIIILLGAVLHHKSLIVNACTNSACITEAARIIHDVDPRIDPCENFYQFACAKVNNSRYRNQSRVMETVNQLSDEIYELYMEAEQHSDTYEEKLLKNIFRKCMNETRIDKNDLKTINDLLESVGGWPVLEGSNWKEDFDWLRATYLLREQGYYFSIFLNFKVVPDPDNATTDIFEVSLPNVYVIHGTLHDTEFLKYIGQIFEVDLLADPDYMSEMDRLIHDLGKLQRTNSSHTKFTIENFQKECDGINWFEFITRIAGPTVKVSADDVVLFPEPQKLKQWFDIISEMPKRIVANHFIWKLISEISPFLTEELRTMLASNSYPTPSRSTFCLEALNERIAAVNPIYVKHAKKYLSKTKRQDLTQILTNIKLQLIESLKNVAWLEDNHKKEIMQIVENMEIVIGLPENYMINPEPNNDVQLPNSNFLNMLSVLNRHYNDQLYNKINKLPYENKFSKLYTEFMAHYFPERNILYIPIGFIQPAVFDENKPNYINYAKIAVYAGHAIVNALNSFNISSKNVLLEEITKVEECLRQRGVNDGVIGSVRSLSSSLQLSYLAYQNWVKATKNEQRVIGVDYSPDQLFWTSAMFTFCDTNYMTDDYYQTYFSHIYSETLRNIPQVSKDLHCEHINPIKQCQFI